MGRGKWKSAVRRGILTGPFLFLCLSVPSAEPSLKPSDIFQPARTEISVTFVEHFTDLSKGAEAPPVEYWVSRGIIGLSFRATYHFGIPVTQLSFLYPDADPFLLRFILIPGKSLCYRSTYLKADYPFDPHRIRFPLYWHRLIDNLYEMAEDEKLNVLGEENVAGYRCKKVAIGALPETGWMIWYSPELDLALRAEKYEYGKLVSRSKASNIREGRIPSDIFKLPPGCPVKSLSNKDFDLLDVAKLIGKH